ncbi:MAG: FHA domain-containing protein [Fimbriimonadaceae bacterium]
MTNSNDLTEHATEVENDGVEAMTESTVDAPPMVNDSVGGDVVKDSDSPEGTANPRLIVKRQGVETEEVFAFVAPATIGRFDPSVGPIDIDLGNIEEGGYVSRKHAKITEAEGTYFIHDLGSSNGVYLLRDDEFQRVTEGELADGDEIAFGNARFVFRLS